MADNKLVAVTGGSGFIAGHVIEQLLVKGHRVRAIVRDASQKDKVAHFKQFPQNPGQLEVSDAPYEESFKGANAVVHTASPYFYTAADPQKEIIDPAVSLTKDAIEAAKKAGVKRIVITSSGGAFLSFDKPQGYVFTDKDWNEWSSLANNPYFLSKKLAEQKAWELYNADKSAIEVVVVNPLYVVGPTHAPVFNTSLTTIKKILTGEMTQPPPGFVGMVDVRDVGRAHVIAVEHPDAAGKRLFAASEVRAWKDIATVLAKLFPELPIAKTDGTIAVAPFSIDTSPIKALGLTSFIPFETMLRDTVLRLLELKMIEKPASK